MLVASSHQSEPHLSSVQLRPMVRNMAKVLMHDVSLLERLYTGPNVQGMSKTMLNVRALLHSFNTSVLTLHAQVQYRFPPQLAVFPSNEFYQGRLRTAMKDASTRLAVLKGYKFPWPTKDEVVAPVVFVQCRKEEDMGGMSKRNEGQAEVVLQVIKLLTTKDAQEEEPASELHSSREPETKVKITVLTPYTKQVSELKARIPRDSEVEAFTIDSFQGRESDIIIFSTVRCNVDRDIGFVEDARRLNVMWTRAKLALIVVGDRDTLGTSALWKRAMGCCEEVGLPEDLVVSKD